MARQLRLTLAGIFAGSIKKWNDPRIREWNKGTSLPDAEIEVLHRADGSGTTYVFTSYLAQSSPDWKPRVGTTVDSPNGTGAMGNEGVAQLVEKTPDSISYVELTFAIQHHMTYAAVRNPAGRFVHADLASITAAAAARKPSATSDHPLSALNMPAKDAYPITTFSWLLISKSSADTQKRAAELRFLH